MWNLSFNCATKAFAESMRLSRVLVILVKNNFRSEKHSKSRITDCHLYMHDHFSAANPKFCIEYAWCMVKIVDKMDILKLVQEVVPPAGLDILWICHNLHFLRDFYFHEYIYVYIPYNIYYMHTTNLICNYEFIMFHSKLFRLSVPL